jgi:hypothetical protein
VEVERPTADGDLTLTGDLHKTASPLTLHVGNADFDFLSTGSFRMPASGFPITDTLLERTANHGVQTDNNSHLVLTGASELRSTGTMTLRANSHGASQLQRVCSSISTLDGELFVGQLNKSSGDIVFAKSIDLNGNKVKGAGLSWASLRDASTQTITAGSTDPVAWLTRRTPTPRAGTTPAPTPAGWWWVRRACMPSTGRRRWWRERRGAGSGASCLWQSTGPPAPRTRATHGGRGWSH